MNCLNIFVVLLLATSVLAATHVNIAIQQQSKDDQLQASGQLKLKSDSVEQLKSDDCNDNADKFARIQDGKHLKYSNQQRASDLAADSADRQAEVRHIGRSGHLVSSTDQQRNVHNSNLANHREQYNNKNHQEKQNMEFERYIQNYHSGPTVETVYESNPAPLRSAKATSSSVGPEESKRTGHRMPNAVKFERQVALPTKSDSVNSASSDVEKQPTVLLNQPVVASEQTAPSVSSSTSSTSPSAQASGPTVSVSSPNGNTLKININAPQTPTSVGSDGLNYDQTSYSGYNYNDPSNFKYDNDDSNNFYHHQYPPSVDESQGGSRDYFHANNENSFYDHNPNEGYLPPSEHVHNPRPVVTKTIQIAQPAIKAKTYEIRHPAIQKEFYDIEERVSIKPAGTVVVELERPVAKISKGEQILPLGHPHPAVAGAYMNNNSPSFSNVIYSGPSSQPNSEKRPSSHIASTITSLPTNDIRAKEAAVEANLNKQYTNANFLNEQKNHPNREIIVITDGQGNQRQISQHPDKFTYSRDETDNSAPANSYNQRNLYHYNNNAEQRSNFREPNPFEAEFINNHGSNNQQIDSKPARLQETPSSAQPIIKHEHNIHLSPSQHNIYLEKPNDYSQTRYVAKTHIPRALEQTARVEQIRPRLDSQRGPFIVYASSNQLPKSEFRPQSQVVQYRDAPNSHLNGNNHVEYNAPYAKMRYHPDDQSSAHHTHARNDYPLRKSERIILDKATMPSSQTKENEMHKNEAPATNIEIKLPNASSQNGKDSAIVVSTTMRPTAGNDDDKLSQKSNLEISITNNGEPKPQEHTNADHQSGNYSNQDDNSSEEEEKSSKLNTDCDQADDILNNESSNEQQKFMRIVEADDVNSGTKKTNNVDVNIKSTSGHLGMHTSRVIAATPAPSTASASESFQRRRIVVNHPFQTVREVVEHEPYTNYHEVQVNEPASPAAYYHSPAYFQTHGSLRLPEHRHISSVNYY